MRKIGSQKKVFFLVVSSVYLRPVWTFNFCEKKQKEIKVIVKNWLKNASWIKNIANEGCQDASSNFNSWQLLTTLFFEELYRNFILAIRKQTNAQNGSCPLRLSYSNIMNMEQEKKNENLQNQNKRNFSSEVQSKLLQNIRRNWGIYFDGFFCLFSKFFEIRKICLRKQRKLSRNRYIF